MLAPKIARFKKKFDRGGVYITYIQFIVVGWTFLKVIHLDKWYWYLSSAFGVVLVRYLAGYLDERIGILKHEQDQYANQNPLLKKMAHDIETIKNQTT